jgi:hypothetical protein
MIHNTKFIHKNSHIDLTVKLSKVKRLPNRTELNTSSSRRTALELFYYFCVFFSKISVRFDRNELYTKKHKNNQKIRKSSGTVRSDKIELVRLSSVRFENLIVEWHS